jgi:hypothetical protein
MGTMEGNWNCRLQQVRAASIGTNYGSTYSVERDKLREQVVGWGLSLQVNIREHRSLLNFSCTPRILQIQSTNQEPRTENGGQVEGG